MWLALGLVLGVGVADVSCGGKGDGGDEETSIASGVTYAGPDTSYSGSGDTDTGDTTSSSPDASGVTYAGPDETWTASEATTTTGSSGSTGSTTDATTSGTSSTGATDSSTGSSTGSSGDASTYAGPDETSTTGP